MANLIAKNISEDIVIALNDRAEQIGMSAEAFNRQLLDETLMEPKKPFIDVLLEMPDVGWDSDFERV